MKGFDLIIKDGDAMASRRELKELFGAPRKTLEDAINKLKKDGLINGAESRLLAKDGKLRKIERFNLTEIILIGFRTRSEKAFIFQKWSADIVKNQFSLQQAQLDHFWDKEDQKDLFR